MAQGGSSGCFKALSSPTPLFIGLENLVLKFPSFSLKYPSLIVHFYLPLRAFWSIFISIHRTAAAPSRLSFASTQASRWCHILIQSSHGFETKPRNCIYDSQSMTRRLAYTLSKRFDVDVYTLSCDPNCCQVSPAPDPSGRLVTCNGISIVRLYEHAVSIRLSYIALPPRVQLRSPLTPPGLLDRPAPSTPFGPDHPGVDRQVASITYTP